MTTDDETEHGIADIVVWRAALLNIKDKNMGTQSDVDIDDSQGNCNITSLKRCCI